jgi:uncharacterized hydrophobic protein (TIGR00271 family)
VHDEVVANTPQQAVRYARRASRAACNLESAFGVGGHLEQAGRAVDDARELVRQSLVSLGVGFPLAFIAAFLVTWAFRATGVAPEVLDASRHPATLFISRPDAYTVVIAALCGVVGMLSLTTASAGTLIGVLISVTTIPAAGNIGVAAAYGNFDEMWGASIQLAVNLAVIQVTGLVTLRIQRAAFAGRVARFVERVRHRRPRPSRPR